MHCKLCGLPNPKSPLRDAGHEFCCNGCREVYRSFGDTVIAGDRPVTAAAPPPQGREAFLWVEGMHCASCEYLIERLAPRTPGILADPKPQVFQTALSDYYPEYRLVAQAIPSSPSPRAEVLSLLHANILDVFNKYGVQIMSPHYMMDPSHPKTVPPEAWCPAPAEEIGGGNTPAPPV